MFDNIGNKIKGLAELICWIGILISVIIALILVFAGYSDGDGLVLFLGIAIGVAGSLFSWIGSFAVYGFGELVQNSIEIKKMIGEKLPPDDGKVNDEKLFKIKAMKAAGQLTEEEYIRAISNLK